MPEEQRNKPPPVRSTQEMIKVDEIGELERQYEEIEFNSAMTCLSLIRFITDHMESLPASIVH